MKFAFIKLHAAYYGVRQLCQLLGVSHSGYYASLKRQPSKRQQDDVILLDAIRKIHQQSAQCYGSPRIHQALVQGGTLCSSGRVKRLRTRPTRAGLCPFECARQAFTPDLANVPEKHVPGGKSRRWRIYLSKRLSR